MEEDAATDHVYYKEELFIDFLGMHQRQEIDLADEPAHVAKQILGPMTQSIEDRLSSLFHKAKTPECRAKIAEHFGYFVNSIGKEEGAPFEDIEFYNHCPEPVYDWDDLPDDIHIGMIQNRSYQPPHNESVYIDDPKNLKILYAILAHDDATATERLVDALYEDGHVFVIHVDGKESSDATYRQLVNYAATRNYVHVLDDSRRVRINWGGFSMVNATMQILKYSFAVDEPNRQPLDFHKFFHVASTSYPLASNAEIRQRLSDFPLDANLMHVILKPSRPPATSWFYFVECDDAVHRIHRLKPLQKETAGIELYTSSQWFIISREFAEYLATAGPGTLAHDFLEYAEHVVVADETYFGTVLRHTEFCTKHHNRNFLHLQFDRWESELPADKRDERKCMMKDPNHCGRSPTVLTVDYVDILELTDDLFARKVSEDSYCIHV